MLATWLWNIFSQSAWTVILFICGVYFSRLALLLWRRRPPTGIVRHRSRLPCRTIITIGSGGHTAEMTRMIEKLNPSNYQPRYYFLAMSDKRSESKIIELEEKLGLTADVSNLVRFLKTSSKPVGAPLNLIRIPRSREVGQSYFSSIFTTIYSCIHVFREVFAVSPDLIICNGPGTCVPICLAAFLLKLITFSDITIVFVESICRVKSLSLSAKLLRPFVDFLLVQWPELAEANHGCLYIGSLL